MGLVSSTAIARDLKAVRETLRGPVLIHSDLSRLGILENVKSKPALLQKWTDLIIESFGDAGIAIPTFNYDFCKTGKYSIANDPSQIGVLTEFVRSHFSTRTPTPVFNFCLLGKKPIVETVPSRNCFGRESFFDKLWLSDGSVLFLGAHFQSNTFIHFVEEVVSIPYRYIKRFSGVIEPLEGPAFPWTIEYRVRPWGTETIEYDWDRLEKQLRDQGILKAFRIGEGSGQVYQTRELFDFWSAEIKKDPLFLLDERSKKLSEDLFRKYGSPLTFEKVES